MAEQVKKREKIPEVFDPPVPVETPEELMIEIGDKKYPVPDIKLKEYKKLLKFIDEAQSKPNSSELDNIEFAQEFFYRILKPHHPDLKKADMDDMPLHQAGATFFTKVKLALYRVPLV